jgi:hypothetical protein
MCANEVNEKVYFDGLHFRPVGNERMGRLNPHDQGSSCSILPFFVLLCLCDGSWNDQRHESRESDQMGGIEMYNVRISDPFS